MKTLFALLICLLWHSTAWSSQCPFDDPELATRPLSDNGPTEISIRIYVNDIISIHDVDQSFVADVLFRAEWSDPRLSHTHPAPCSATVDQIWSPVLQLLNRRHIERIRDPELSVSPDGNVLFLLRSLGSFSFQADLSDFPFDAQQISFKVVSTYGPDEVRLVTEADSIGISDTLSIANWTIEMQGAEHLEHYVPPVDRYLARLDLVFKAKRLTGYYTWQQLLPLFLIVMMTWLVFWIPNEFLPARVGLAATSMLTLIAYRFAMSSVLPPIAYLTRLDIFMIGASTLVFAGLSTAVAVSFIAEQGNVRLAQKINDSARWLSPLALAVITVNAFLV